MSIFRFIKWIDEEKPINIYGDGTQSRDFTWVEDVADGVCRALKPLGCEIINIGGGREAGSLLEIIAKIEKILGKKDSEKISELLNSSKQKKFIVKKEISLKGKFK